ncbi:hypothetical protein KKG46_05735 [Patescibacteria group bacterium]|nr:hypothetical protein [Patescibacteria group bacterium]
MKKEFLTIFALLSFFLLPGCGTSNANNVDMADRPAENLIVQRPERDPDMMGMVSNLVGNQATILLFNEEDMPFATSTRSAQGSSQGGQDQGAGFNPSAAFGATGGAVGAGRGMGGGFSGAAGGQGPDGQAFDRDAMLAARDEMIKELKAKSIGSETVTIPVGIPIIGGGRSGADQGGASQISFSEIQKDSLITIWLNQDITDKNVAEFVSLMGGGFGGNRMSGGINTSQN